MTKINRISPGLSGLVAKKINQDLQDDSQPQDEDKDDKKREMPPESDFQKYGTVGAEQLTGQYRLNWENLSSLRPQKHSNHNSNSALQRSLRVGSVAQHLTPKGRTGNRKVTQHTPPTPLRMSTLGQKLNQTLGDAESTLTKLPQVDPKEWQFLEQGRAATSGQMLHQIEQAILALKVTGTPIKQLESFEQSLETLKASQKGDALSELNWGSNQPNALQTITPFITKLNHTTQELRKLLMPSFSFSTLWKPTKPSFPKNPSFGSAFGSDGTHPNAGVKATQDLPPFEVKHYRSQINLVLGNSRAIHRLVKNPKAMALATPDEKADMLRTLHQGWSAPASDFSSLDIALSCSSKQEFDYVMEQAGDLQICKELRDIDAMERFNILMGMWGRPEWGSEQHVVSLAANALSQQAPPPITRNTAKVGQSSDPSAERYLALEERGTNIYWEPNTFKELICTNAIRQAEGHYPLDWQQANNNILGILEDKSLSTERPAPAHIFPSPKESAIEAIRRDLGLSKVDMRRLFIQRLICIYSDMAKEFANVRKMDANTPRLRMMGQLGGQKGRGNKEDRALTALQQQESIELKELSVFLEELYKPSENPAGILGEYYSKLSHFIHYTFQETLSIQQIIPEADTAMMDAFRGIKLTEHISRTQDKQEAQPLSPFPEDLSEFIGDLVGHVVRQGSEKLQRVETELLPKIPTSRYQDAMELLAELKHTTQMVLTTNASAATYILGVRSSNPEAALVGLGGIARQFGAKAGQLSQKLYEKLQQGVYTLTHLIHADLRSHIQTLGERLGTLSQTPSAQEAITTLQSGYYFSEQLSNGRLQHAVQQFLEKLGPMVQHYPQLQSTAQQLQSVSHFAEGVTNKSAQQSLEYLATSVYQVTHHGSLSQGLQWLKQVGQLLASQRGKPHARIEAISLNGYTATLLKAMYNGDVYNGAQGLAYDIKNFLQSPHIQGGQYWLESSAHFLSSLHNGSLYNAIYAMNQPGSPLENQDFMNELLHITYAGQNFIQGVASGQLQYQLLQVQHAHPEMGGEPHFQQVMEYIEPMLQFVLHAGSGQVTQQLNETKKLLEQLTDSERVIEALRPLQIVIHRLVEKYGGPIEASQRALTTFVL